MILIEKMNGEQISEMVLRLQLPQIYQLPKCSARIQTSTKSSSGTRCRANSIIMKDLISATDVDIKASSLRLYRTKTKSAGTKCRSIPMMSEPGLGQKTLPIIEGEGVRFLGLGCTPGGAVESSNAIGTRLTSASTHASRARLENHRILLYPERVLLCNDVARIAAFQENGSLLKQKDMNPREKWFN